MELDKISSFAMELAISAGEIALTAREKPDYHIRSKGVRDLVTSADTAVEKFIVNAINNRFPGHLVLAEESQPEIDYRPDLSPPLWVIDPIDGTINFAHELSISAVSIGFYVKGRAQVGVIHNPFQKETFFAVRGRGAFLNGKRIRPSQVQSLDAALIGVGRPPRTVAAEDYFQQLHAVMRHCMDIRRFGAGSLDICMVACGRWDGFWETLKPWDIGAALLIAREAGARVGHLAGIPEDHCLGEELCPYQLLVAAPGIFDVLYDLLRPKRKDGS